MKLKSSVVPPLLSRRCWYGFAGYGQAKRCRAERLISQPIEGGGRRWQRHRPHKSGFGSTGDIYAELGADSTHQHQRHHLRHRRIGL